MTEGGEMIMPKILKIEIEKLGQKVIKKSLYDDKNIKTVVRVFDRIDDVDEALIALKVFHKTIKSFIDYEDGIINLIERYMGTIKNIGGVEK
jgi:hypothetical protein